jgi:mono/diheme cytochrome c family protein
VTAALAFIAAPAVKMESAGTARASAAQDCTALGVAGCDAQGTMGAAVYVNSCALCHGDALEGLDGPALVGPSSAVLDQRTGRRLYDTVSTWMPDDDPGSLSEREYLDVIAFLLHANGLHPGGEISQAALDGINLR